MHAAEVERRPASAASAATPRSRRAPPLSSRASAARPAGLRTAAANCRRRRRGSAAPAGRRARAPRRRVDVHERLLRRRHVEERVARRRHLAEPRPDGEQQVGLANTRRELRVDADADVADVARRVVVERVLAAERRAGGQRVRLEERAQVARRGRRPAGATENRERPLGSFEQRRAPIDVPWRPGTAARPGTDGHRRRPTRAASMSSGSASTTGPGRPAHAVVNARATSSGIRSTRSICATHLAICAEHAAVVDLLERLAFLLIRGDLADEQDQRRRVLERRMHADRGVGRARPAGDEADPGTAGQLAVGLGHVRGSRLVAAGDQPDRGCRVSRRGARCSSRPERRTRARRRGRPAGRRAACRRARAHSAAARGRCGPAAASASPRPRDRRSVIVRFPAHSRGQHEHAHEGRLLGLGRGRDRPGPGRSRTTIRTGRTRATFPASRS